MWYIDIMSSIRLNITQALLKAKAAVRAGNISFSGHALKELLEDDLDRSDAINVLLSSSARITDQAELVNGTWRYRVKTKTICVVIAFQETDRVVVITVFRILRR